MLKDIKTFLLIEIGLRIVGAECYVERGGSVRNEEHKDSHKSKGNGSD